MSHNLPAVQVIEELLGNINPLAKKYHGLSGFVKGVDLLALRAYHSGNMEQAAKRAGESKDGHHGGISSVTLRMEYPVDFTVFNFLLGNINSFLDVDVFRAKGFICTSELEDRMIFQLVGDGLVWLQGKEWDEAEVEGCILVFIGKRINKSLLSNYFNARVENRQSHADLIP